jgi:hypothetical protein
MTRAWLFGIAAVVAVQSHVVLRETSDLSYSMQLYWRPLIAMCWYFGGLALASTRTDAPRGVWLAALLGVGIVALFTSPFAAIVDPVHLVLPVIGLLALSVALVWLCRALWIVRRLAGFLVGVGALLGGVALIRMFARSYVVANESELDFAGMISFVTEFTYLLAIGGALCALAALVRWAPWAKKLLGGREAA